MLIVLVVTLVLAGLRLWGQTSTVYQALSHVYVGALAGYYLGAGSWFVALNFLLLCAVELYMVLSKYFPAIAISTLLAKTAPVVTTTKK